MFKIGNIPEVIFSNMLENKYNDESSEGCIFDGESKQQTSEQGWNSNYNKIVSSLKISNYVWTPIKGNDDIIKKSQNHLIDLIRYYEGDSNNNYRAKFVYNDKNKVKTYGYGIVNSSDAIREKLAEEGVELPPKSEAEAYRAMLVYLQKISLPEVSNNLKNSGINYDELPNSIKEGLLDLHFNKGLSKISKNSELKTALKDKNWAEAIKAMVVAEAAADKGVMNPGLYRRSFSRAILAVRDVGKTEDIKNALQQIYNDALASVDTWNSTQPSDKRINKDDYIAEMDKIFDMYNNPQGSVDKKSEDASGEKSYLIPRKMGLFSVANAIIPEKTADKNGIDSKELRIAVIKEIMAINEIQYVGEDNSGYPKVNLLESDSTIKLPKTVTIGNKKIQLKTPEEFEEVSVSNDQSQQAQEEQLAGTYVVKKGQGWWQIARDVAPDNYTEHQIKELAAAIEKCNESRYKGVSVLNEGDTIELPPENWQGGDDSSDIEIEDEPEVQTPLLTKMLDSMQYSSKNPGKVKDFECITFEYSVKEGDKLYSLANEYGVDLKTLLSNNGLTLQTASNLSIGQKIKINKIAYTVKKDETIASIAKKYGLSEDLLRTLNGNNEAKQGDKIEIPGYMYRVVDGDNLTKIAKNAGVKIEQLKNLNGLTSDAINKNQELLILYNNPDYNIPESKKRTVKVGDSEIQTIDDMNPANKERTHFKLQKENGKVVATRKVFNENSEIKGPLSGKTIVINAGHGYCQDGKIDVGTNVGEIKLKNDNTPDEYQCSYDNAMRLKDELVKKGAKVIYIQGHAKLVQEELAKSRNKADLFISLHVNSSTQATRDRTIFCYTSTNNAKYPKTNVRQSSIDLASTLEKSFDEWIPKNETISKNDEFTSMGIQDYAQTKAQTLGVCNCAEKYLKCPAVLWEVAFMSAGKGRNRLKNDALMNKYMKLAADGIEKTILTPEDTRPKYTVKKGDSLGSIAKRYNTDVKTLQKLNGLKSTAIREGQGLVLPESKSSKTQKGNNNSSVNTHTVKANETLGSIAIKYNTTVSAIKNANGLKGDIITIGQTLKIPKN